MFTPVNKEIGWRKADRVTFFLFPLFLSVLFEFYHKHVLLLVPENKIFILKEKRKGAGKKKSFEISYYRLGSFRLP